MKLIHKNRLKLYENQNHMCYYCGDKMIVDVPDRTTQKSVHLKFATFEHLDRVIDGGKNHTTNVVLCCHECNSHRGSISPDIWKIVCKDIIAIRLKKRELISYVNRINNRVQRKKVSKLHPVKREFVLRIRPIVKRIHRTIELGIINIARYQENYVVKKIVDR